MATNRSGVLKQRYGENGNALPDELAKVREVDAPERE